MSPQSKDSISGSGASKGAVGSERRTRTSSPSRLCCSAIDVECGNVVTAAGGEL